MRPVDAEGRHVSGEQHLRPERILELSDRLSRVAGAKIAEIAGVNRHARMLSINALIEAARAGAAGRGFAVVAEEMKNISAEIDAIADTLQTEVSADLHELGVVGEDILRHLRGQRLADLALNAIEIIDRNLYERTCDVRWWATDSAVVACAAATDGALVAEASRRLGVILSAYTVYLDLWICDAQGRVVAIGRPERYPRAQGASVRHEPWFQAALTTKTGDEFTVADVALNTVLGDRPTATYAAAIREDGRANGRVIGVLGVHFDWAPQARAVVEGVRLTPEERARSRVMILDQSFRVLASSDGRGVLTDTYRLPVRQGDMGAADEGGRVIAWALTPGYETYAGLGWYGCIVQDAAMAGQAVEAA